MVNGKRSSADGERCPGAPGITTFRPPLWVRALIAWSCTSVPLCMSAQDIHFTQFFNTPYATNPANTGLFDGQYRVAAVYRQQWRSVTVPYRTFGIGGDMADVAGLKGLGAGLRLYNDRAGDSRLNTFHLSAAVSWTQRFGTGHAQSITGGIQAGFTSLSIDYSALRYDAQYNGYYFDPSLSNNEQFTRDAATHPDLHAGLIYRYAPDKRRSIQAGIALFNLTTPRIDLNGDLSPLDRRTALHVTTRFPVSAKLDVQPMAQYMAQATFRELLLGGSVRYILKDKYTYLRTVQAGLFWRAADAGMVFAGIEFDDWTAGLSYDLNFSKLVPASRNRGGFEITVIRVFRKKPFVPVRYKACPTQL